MDHPLKCMRRLYKKHGHFNKAVHSVIFQAYISQHWSILDSEFSFPIPCHLVKCDSKAYPDTISKRS
jgi:hypothetical protein